MDEENAPKWRMAYADANRETLRITREMLERENICHVDAYDIKAREGYTPEDSDKPIKPGREFIGDVRYGSSSARPYDVIMVSKDGLPYIPEIREFDPGMLVVLYSGSLYVRKLAEEYKCDALIEKPATAEKIQKTIKDLLAGD